MTSLCQKEITSYSHFHLTLNFPVKSSLLYVIKSKTSMKSYVLLDSGLSILLKYSVLGSTFNYFIDRNPTLQL